MKRMIQSVIIFLIVIGIPGFVLSQTWYPTNSAILVWDAITTLADGTPIPQGQNIQYNIYTAILSPTGVPGTPVLAGTTNTSQFTITFLNYGKFYIGVSSSLMEGQNILFTSETSWSSNPAFCYNSTVFGVVYVAILGPHNMRISQGQQGSIQIKK